MVAFKRHNSFILSLQCENMASDEKKLLKMAIIAGASRALQFKREQRYATDEDAIQHVAHSSNDIISKLDTEE